MGRELANIRQVARACAYQRALRGHRSYGGCIASTPPRLRCQHDAAVCVARHVPYVRHPAPHRAGSRDCEAHPSELLQDAISRRVSMTGQVQPSLVLATRDRSEKIWKAHPGPGACQRFPTGSQLASSPPASTGSRNLRTALVTSSRVVHSSSSLRAMAR